MNIRKLSIVSIALMIWFAPYAYASEQTKLGKVRELARITRIYEMVEKQRLVIGGDAQKNAARVLSPLYLEYPDIADVDNPYRKWLEATYAKYVKNVFSVLQSDEILPIFIKAYSTEMTEYDLDAVLAFYRTAAGQKDINATMAGMSAINDHIAEEMRTRLVDATKKFSSEIAMIGQEYKRSRVGTHTTISQAK